jgi:hypothetical protein
MLRRFLYFWLPAGNCSNLAIRNLLFLKSGKLGPFFHKNLCMCQDHICRFKKIANFAQKSTVCDHSLIFNPRKKRKKRWKIQKFLEFFFNKVNSEFSIQLYIIWKHRPLPKGWSINLCPPSLPSFLFPSGRAGWTSIHQGTIDWMPIITQLWMNLNWVNIWFHLGN